MAVLKGTLGRTNDFLILNGLIVSNPDWSSMLSKFDIEQYQIIQEDSSSITFKIIKGNAYKKEDEKPLMDSVQKHVGKVNIKFDYTSSIPTIKAGKYKFIINKWGI